MFTYSILKRFSNEAKMFVRYKNPPEHWSVLRKKNHPVDKALEHFDDFYNQVYDKQWLSIRKALLGKQKYVAVINNYGDDEETMKKLELQGALNIRRLFELEKEYMKEGLRNKQCDAALNKIFELDRQLDEDNNTKEIVEDKSNTSPNQHNMSLESALASAEYDTSRLITPNNPFSSDILYGFVPTTELKGMDDFIPESTHYKMYDGTQFGVKIEREYDIHFPAHLNIYCYEKGNKSQFENSKKGATGVLNYYLMDGGSILPILALDLKPGNRMLDMCAAPGGKSLLAIQTFYPDSIVSNDQSASRSQRINNVFKQFLYDLDEKWFSTGKLELTRADGRFYEGDDFDRILVDVPCTTDRHSLHENDNNIFKITRVKERLKLPELQRDLLFQALKLVNKGGIVVYSTCSLSPIQNDGVVQMALKKIWEETNMEFIVKDLSPALLQTQSVFEFADRKLLKYGHLVLPSALQNYGPTYFCKLQKIK